jgi:hypothetical protein
LGFFYRGGRGERGGEAGTENGFSTRFVAKRAKLASLSPCFKTEAPVCPEVSRWVLSFGKGATVLQPATLRAHVAGEGKGIQRNNAGRVVEENGV